MYRKSVCSRLLQFSIAPRDQSRGMKSGKLKSARQPDFVETVRQESMLPHGQQPLCGSVYALAFVLNADLHQVCAPILLKLHGLSPDASNLVWCHVVSPFVA